MVVEGVIDEHSQAVVVIIVVDARAEVGDAVGTLDGARILTQREIDGRLVSRVKGQEAAEGQRTQRLIVFAADIELVQNSKRIASEASNEVHNQFNLILELGHHDYDKNKIKIDLSKNPTTKIIHNKNINNYFKIKVPYIRDV